MKKSTKNPRLGNAGRRKSINEGKSGYPQTSKAGGGSH